MVNCWTILGWNAKKVWHKGDKRIIEQALPQFEKQEEVKTESPHEEEVYAKQSDDLIVTVPSFEYVKSGYFGMSSYTIYRIETRVLKPHLSSHSPILTDSIHEKPMSFIDDSAILIG